MEEDVVEEIVNTFYEKELADKNIDYSKKEKMCSQKEGEVLLEIDSLVLDIVDSMTRNGENIGNSEFKKIRHNVLRTMHIMNERGIPILDGSGKINVEAVKKSINETNLSKFDNEEKLENQKEGIEDKTIVSSDVDLIKKLESFNLSEEDIEYFTGAIENEKKREDRYRKDVEEYGEERARQNYENELRENPEAQLEALSLAAIRDDGSSKFDKVNKARNFEKKMMQGLDKVDELENDGKISKECAVELRNKIKAMRIYNTSGLGCEIFQDKGEDVFPLGIGVFSEDYENVMSNYELLKDDDTLAAIVDLSDAPEYFQRHIEENNYESNFAYQNSYTFWDYDSSSTEDISKELVDNYRKINDIDEINLLVEQGIPKEEIQAALKHFQKIINEMNDEMSVDEVIETFIKERSQPLNEIQTAILRNMKKITFDGVSLKDIIEDEERQEDLIDKIDSLIDRLEKDELPIKDNEFGPVFEILGDVIDAGVSQNLEGQETLLPKNTEESGQREPMVSEVYLQSWGTNNVMKDIGRENKRKYITKADCKRLYLKFGSKESTEQVVSNIGWLATDKDKTISASITDKNDEQSNGEPNPSTPPGEEKE